MTELLFWLPILLVGLGTVYFAPDDGSGGGGGDDPPNEPEKKYTDADVERMIHGRIRPLSVQVEKEKTKNSELQTQIDQLTATVERMQGSKNDPSGSGDNKGGDKDAEIGRLELAIKNHKADYAALEKQLEQEKQSRESVERQLREMDRDNQLSRAMVATRCEGGRQAEVFFRSNLVFDEDDTGEWRYKNQDGRLVDIETGVAAEMPDYWKPASLRGGSGSATTPKRAAQQKKLQDEEQRLTDLKTKASNSGQTADLLAYQRQKKVVDSLKKDLSTTG